MEILLEWIKIKFSVCFIYSSIFLVNDCDYLSTNLDYDYNGNLQYAVSSSWPEINENGKPWTEAVKIISVGSDTEGEIKNLPR